jgi:hypothetical protein
MLSLDPARAAKYEELIAWALPRIEARYQKATPKGWIYGLDNAADTQRVPDCDHAGRDARLVAFLALRGDAFGKRWLPMMVDGFHRAYNPAIHRFSEYLDGSGTPVQNFGHLWASLAAVDVDVHRIMEGYGASLDPYKALVYAELAEAARVRGLLT